MSIQKMCSVSNACSCECAADMAKKWYSRTQKVQLCEVQAACQQGVSK
jgi:hypothetical protein